MINVPDGYQDAHGITYNGAVILISHMSHSIHASIQMNLALDPTAINYSDTGVQSNAQIGFTAVIYPSQQALDERRQPLQFRPDGHPEYFNIPLETQVNKEDLLATCEQWLMDTIFSTGPA